jgi:hypothetical protein
LPAQRNRIAKTDVSSEGEILFVRHNSSGDGGVDSKEPEIISEGEGVYIEMPLAAKTRGYECPWTAALVDV